MLRWLRPGRPPVRRGRNAGPHLTRTLAPGAAGPSLPAALDDQEGALLARSAWLLASKSINGAQGLDVTDAMRLSIAASQACPS